MRAFLLSAVKYVLYPLFYVVCLLGFVYFTFPWEALRNRVEHEFAKSQASKGSRAWRLEITSVDGYWLSGIEVKGAKIIMPPDEEEDDEKGVVENKGALARVTSQARADKAEEKAAAEAESGDAKDSKDKDKEKPKAKESVVLIEDAHARVRMLPLLLGRVRVDFATHVFGGQISGMIPVGGGDLVVDIENIDLSQVAPLKDIVSVPLAGNANGKLELSAPTGKWSKANGSFTLTITQMVMGDGKAKFRDKITLPPATIGTFEMVAKADSGLLKIDKFGAQGQDVDLFGEGTIKLKEPWDASAVDVWLRFGFSEAYKNTNDKTKAMFLDDGPWPALISQDRRMKRAKRPDGLWGFHIRGKLSRLRYDPTAADPKGGTSAGGDTVSKKKKTKDDDEEDMGSSGVLSQPTSHRTPAFSERPKSSVRQPSDPSNQEFPDPRVDENPNPAGVEEPGTLEPNGAPPADPNVEPPAQPDGVAEPAAPEQPAPAQ
ncbi:MAG: type II secretion system protein GspN [Polyangiaceae bacterium]